MKNKLIPNTWFNFIILIIFVILSIFCVDMIRTKLLQNAQEMGTYLTQNYSVEEQNNIILYQTLMNLSTQYIDEQISKNHSLNQIQTCVYEIFDNVGKVLNKQPLNLYVILDDNIITAHSKYVNIKSTVKNTTWYQQTLNTDGKVIFSDTYTDILTDKKIISIAQKTTHSDAIVVFDVFIEDFHAYTNSLSLPKGSSYFLFDQSGNPLYYLTDTKHSYEEIELYIQELFRKVKTGKLLAYDKTIQDIEGHEQGVYYYEMKNGWISILTIPIHTILKDLKTFISILLGIFFSLLSIIIFMAVRDYKLHRKVQFSNDIAQVLGNSYYAIYLVNYKYETYRTIKSSEDLKDKIAPIGNYKSLLEIISSSVDESTYHNMIQSFSIENIRKLVFNQVHDFGGDYLRRFDNIEKWVNVRLLFDNTLDQGEAVLCFQEVDKEKTKQLQQMHLLQSALEFAQKNDKIKTNYFNSLSHDMRTPLNAIIGLSELAQQNLHNQDKLRNYINKILVSSKQLLSLINDVLELSRLEDDCISIDYTEVNLQQCIQECTDTFYELAKKEQKTFDVQFDIRDIVVMCDPLRISQILNNLISNAFKYSDIDANIKVFIKQCNYTENPRYQIIVSDTGIGMSEEFLPRIFDSYAQENRFGSKHIMGTGLGMPIVKRLVKQMGGEIAVESKLSKGSTFTITLPLKIVKGAEPLPEKQPITQAFTLKGKRILLVEDNEINMEIAKEILSMNGLEVIKAWNGEEAVEAFKCSTLYYFDAILMDMLMPKLNGCEATKIIRKLDRPDAMTIPIIAVTANAFAEDISMTTEAGMNAHIAKPIDFNLLYQTLQDLSYK